MLGANTSMLSIMIRPETWHPAIRSVRRLRQVRKLVFPHPDGPTRAVMQPKLMERVTLWKAGV